MRETVLLQEIRPGDVVTAELVQVDIIIACRSERASVCEVKGSDPRLRALRMGSRF